MEVATLCRQEFIGNGNVSLILGDNIFYGNMRLEEIYQSFNGGALVFGYSVHDPDRYGIIEFDKEKTDEVIVYDWFAVRSGSKHEYNALADVNSDFCHTLLFHPSTRKATRKEIKDLVYKLKN